MDAKLPNSKVHVASAVQATTTIGGFGEGHLTVYPLERYHSSKCSPHCVKGHCVPCALCACTVLTPGHMHLAASMSMVAPNSPPSHPPTTHRAQSAACAKYIVHHVPHAHGAQFTNCPRHILHIMPQRPKQPLLTQVFIHVTTNKCYVTHSLTNPRLDRTWGEWTSRLTIAFWAPIFFNGAETTLQQYDKVSVSKYTLHSFFPYQRQWP